MTPSKHVPKVALFAIALLLGGCMTPTPYAPRMEGQLTGYTDRSLAPNRYRVTFTGNSSTPVETVEDYLLLRAAEVTRAAGYDHFVFDTRSTNATGSGSGSGFSFGTGFGFGSGGYGSGFGSGVGIGYGGGGGRSNTEAYAEILLLTPEQAAQQSRAVRASDVIERLRPRPRGG